MVFLRRQLPPQTDFCWCVLPINHPLLSLDKRTIEHQSNRNLFLTVLRFEIQNHIASQYLTFQRSLSFWFLLVPSSVCPLVMGKTKMQLSLSSSMRYNSIHEEEGTIFLKPHLLMPSPMTLGFEYMTMNRYVNVSHNTNSQPSSTCYPHPAQTPRITLLIGLSNVVLCFRENSSQCHSFSTLTSELEVGSTEGIFIICLHCFFLYK